MLSKEAQDAWPYGFGLTYSVTLSKEGLETTMNVRNQGEESFEFHVLLHTYLHVQVSLVPDLDRSDGGMLTMG